MRPGIFKQKPVYQRVIQGFRVSGFQGFRVSGSRFEIQDTVYNKSYNAIIK